MATALEKKMEPVLEEKLEDPEYDKMIESFTWMDRVIKHREGKIPILIPRNKEDRKKGDFNILLQDLNSGHVRYNGSYQTEKNNFVPVVVNWRTLHATVRIV